MLESIDLTELECMEVEDESYFHLIPQEAITQTLFKNVKQNAIWDFHITKEGRVFFPLCAELDEALYVRLYEYNTKTKEFELCFNLEDNIIVKDNAIRPSKIHTSISTMNDGRLIMTTHTTARAPQHPFWMVDGYYNHQWEGYQGSNILIYNPETKEVENRGVPVPFETIYGGVYSEKNNCFYFSGMIKGHLYKYDIDKNTIKDYGQTTEFGSYKFHLGKDGNVYTTTRSGRMYRIDTEKDSIEYYDDRLPENSFAPSKMNTQMGFATNGPDGDLYISGVFSQVLFKFGIKNQKLFDLGSYITENFKFPYAYKMDGLAFDSKGTLWYTVVLMDEIWQSRGVRLFSWDIFSGGKPVDYGFLGTEKRGVQCVSEMDIHNDIIYIADSNRMFDPPGVIEIDINFLKTGNFEKRVKTKEAASYVCVKNGGRFYDGDYEDEKNKFLEYMTKINSHFSFLEKNKVAFEYDDAKVIKLWMEINPRDSAVLDVKFEGEKIVGYLKDHKFVYVKELKIEEYNGEIPTQIKSKMTTEKKLPTAPGRQYLAEISASVDYIDGKAIVGTKDGFLAIIDEKTCKSIGKASTNGEVRSLCFCKKTNTVYGVAGHDEDTGNIFSYNEIDGLLWLGRTYINVAREPGLSMSSVLSSCDISDDGKKLIIGSKDALGVVYIYNLKEKVDY